MNRFLCIRDISGDLHYDGLLKQFVDITNISCVEAKSGTFGDMIVHPKLTYIFKNPFKRIKKNFGIMLTRSKTIDISHV